MGIQEFNREDEIFENEDVLRDSYSPSTLTGRSDELAEFQNALKPVINGSLPKNLFVYGQTGVGKTVSTEMILDRLTTDQRKYDDLAIRVVNLVCKSLTSSYQVSIRLVNEFREPGTKISRRGHAPGDIYEMLWDHLNNIEATHVLFVLDEIDSIGSDDDILYELPRCNTNGNVKDTKVGVIGISNNFTFRDNLTSRVKDSLCEEEIHFPPYDASQLRAILEQRSTDAFMDGVLTDDVIPLCAAFAGQESGSARHALKLLYKSGDLARSENGSTVTETDVREAEELIEKGRITDELQKLPTQSLLTLTSLYVLSRSGKTPAKRNSIYDLYDTIAEEADADSKTVRTIHDRLSQLSLKGFLSVDAHNKGSHGGSYYEYELDIPLELVEGVISSWDRVASYMEYTDQ